MKKYIKVFLLLIGTYSYSQSTVKGTVTDEQNNPIPSANVVIVGTNDGATTDIDGNFTIKTAKTGAQKIKGVFIGFFPQTKSITISGDVTVNFSLKESIESLDEVVLTVSSSKRSQKETPLSITSLSAKDLTKLNTSSQANILRSIPGITTENGGGEVASNVFVRGLPSGGQFQFNPLQIDGMPVLATFGLNSSAHDVYFRTDIGIKSLEFVRGGSSVLYGVGSVAGIINYTSVTGSETPKNILKLELGTNSRYKADFLTSGQLGGKDSKLFYALTGFYRYDEGPIKTGLPTEGYQLRGNIKKETEKGSITFSGQFIDDQVQFFLPYPLEGGTRNRPTGNDGNEILTLQTVAASNFSYKTPNGMYTSPIRDGVSTKGGYFMTNFVHNFNDNLKIDAKIRKSKYEHQFNLFLDGSGVSGAKAVETQQEYKDARGLTTGNFTLQNGTALDPNARLFENRILDRNRPLSELVSDIKLSYKTGIHTLTGGTFMSRSEAGDFNVTTSYLSEYSNRPDLVNLSGYTVNGITNRGVGYTNRNISSNKLAFFFADEIKLDRWNFDIGIRHETASGNIENEKTKSYTVDNTGISNLDNVVWGTGSFQTGHVSANDFAVALAALYKVNDNASVYGNFSRGYFFPELRSVKFDAFDNPSSYTSEKIVQGEAGLKYGKGSFSGTLAAFMLNLSDRRAIEFINDPNSAALIEKVDKQSTKSYGLETTWNWRFIEGFTFNGTFTYQKHEVTKSEKTPAIVGNKLVRQPNVMSKLGLSYDKANFDANLDYSYAGDKFANEANTIKLEGFGIVDLNLGYTFNIGQSDETLRLGLQSFNLLNSDGITEGSPRIGNNQTEEEFFVGRPIIPRTALVNLTFSF
ncbi:TonB-dependent receptor [Flavobacterium degerlachei]|jgi:outer membrane receptor protein involved in Fe transport|uniref:Outer membrane receptor proteins, mostly Fe transport n=1 Tax=Flavobacterium degerlachei TaxID=229203 RepID=A0A1H2R3M2_9FLAO|nr:TonB-dependent receptor [Flavobacterium degerlachei]SDW13951.1 Outer membrane receptor proteins, mostly Fe transport [Flavobacterium degerlachei]